MAFVSSVGQKYVRTPLCPDRAYVIVKRFPDFLAVIAQTIDTGIQFLQADFPAFFSPEALNIGIPRKSLIKGIFLEIIMVSRHQNNLCIRYGRKKIIHLFQFSFQRLPVE